MFHQDSIRKTSFTAPRSSPNNMSSKSKKLHDSHKMSPKEESWFNLDPNQFPPYWQNYQQFYPQSSSGQTKSSSLPCFQSVYNINKGCYEELPISVSSEDHQLQSQNDYNPCFQHQEENFSIAEEQQSYLQENMGHIYNNLMNFVEITLVQSVCQRSQLEYNQQNRMAAEILAASSLNPNAKEFTPKHANFDEECREIVRNYGKEDTIMQFDGSSELIENDESPQVIDDAIPIEDEDESLVIVDKNTGDKTNCDKVNDSESDDDEDDEDWDEEDEDDWDWDSDEEHASVQCVDLAEFEDLFQVNLLVTNLGSCHQPPSSCQSSNPLLREVNKRFLKLYPNTCCEKSEPCRVKFSDNPVVILEPESLAEELQEARINSEFIRRKADRERNERLLAPILTQTHRQNMFKKIYGDNI